MVTSPGTRSGTASALGAGSSPGARRPSPTTPAPSATAFGAFASCLAQHGVKLPQGRFPGRRSASGATRPRRTPAEQKAFTACRSKLPGGGRFRGRGGPGGRPQSPAFAKYTQCLKAHGVTFGKTSSRTAFQKAQTACARLRPALGS